MRPASSHRRRRRSVRRGQWRSWLSRSDCFARMRSPHRTCDLRAEADPGGDTLLHDLQRNPVAGDSDLRHHRAVYRFEPHGTDEAAPALSVLRNRSRRCACHCGGVALFPNMDSITSLVVVVAAVAFLSAWVIRSPYMGTVGTQIGFAFFLTTLQGFGATTQIATARDRVFGVLLGVIVMWFIFDQIWPTRTSRRWGRFCGGYSRRRISCRRLSRVRIRCGLRRR